MTKDGRDCEYWLTFFEDFLTKSLKTVGYRARRSRPIAGNIVKEIIEDLAWSKLILAVLTDFNPNVWYELGVCHALRRGGTILVCQEDQIAGLPFDLKHHGVVSYKQSLDRDFFTEQLRQRMESATEHANDSPVSEFLTSELTYCVNRAFAGRVEVRKRLVSLKDDDAAIAEVDRINREWKEHSRQLVVFKDGKLLRHSDPTLIGKEGISCYTDPMMNNESHYPEMHCHGKGFWLGNVSGYSGRLTAVAYETLIQKGWMIVVETHLRPGDL